MWVARLLGDVLSQVVDPLNRDDGGDGKEHVHDEYRAHHFLHLRCRDLASFPECEHDLERDKHQNQKQDKQGMSQKHEGV